MKTLSSCNTGI